MDPMSETLFTYGPLGLFTSALILAVRFLYRANTENLKAERDFWKDERERDRTGRERDREVYEGRVKQLEAALDKLRNDSVVNAGEWIAHSKQVVEQITVLLGKLTKS